MYVPKFSAVGDGSVALDLLRRAGVGHLVSHVDDDFEPTVMPFLIDDQMSTIRGHLARANLQWKPLDQSTVLLIVPVADAYVSPSWYPSKLDDPKVVPTWNYEVVHVHGSFVLHDDAEWVEMLVRDLTDHREALRPKRSNATGATPAAWSVDDAPQDFIDRQLRAIVGVEVRIERIEAKRKLSQNRSSADQAEVARALDESSHPNDHALAQAMRR